MKESKVHLFSTNLAMNNNRSHAVTSPYVELLEEQKSFNLHYMEQSSHLRDLCQTILDKVQDQEIAIDEQKRIQRQNYLNLRNMVIGTAQTTKKSTFHIEKLTDSNKRIMEQSRKQGEVINILHRRIVRQKNFLNNSSINQSRYMKDSMEKYNSLEQMNKTILNNIKLQKEEQERFFSNFLEMLNIQKVPLVDISITQDNYLENESNQQEE
ncbi:hypothetical protein PB01_01725 [Psychrobacillus glaciei]|uniref:Uncharacterized protein n=1 Tax=Psychrobacillus glaciei TaxID=2283160 RepID=A0A5J6SIJ5_9BACI|nr:hypothetical protein [Psychrobacillus glaciei]QFF97628.1 hypothetical protein PB01_01725 [Psychrobacillus glaciei]